MQRSLLVGIALVVLAVSAGCAGGQATTATNVTTTSATLSGYWQTTNANALTVVWFELGTTTAYGNYVWSYSPAQESCSGGLYGVPGGIGPYAYGSECHSSTANTPHAYSAATQNNVFPVPLAPDTTYHFRLCANDGHPNTNICLGDKTFTTSGNS